MGSFSRLLVGHANDIALLIYTGAVIVWGWVFAVVLRKRWGSWRHSHREPLTADEWILIGLMVVGLILIMLYMYTFLHGRPPGSLLDKGVRLYEFEFEKKFSLSFLMTRRSTFV